MIPKQDRQGVRKATDIERKYKLNMDTAEIEKLATNAMRAASNAQSLASLAVGTANSAMSQISVFATSIEDILRRLEILEAGGGGGSVLPDGYTPLEYIESSGTQYIDTGFKPNNNTKVSVVFQSSAGNANISIVGADSGWANNGFGIYLTSFEFGSSSFMLSTKLNDGSKHEVILDKGHGFIDGNAVWSASGNFSADYNMYLLSSNRSGSAFYTLVGKLYSCQIYDNDTLVRDFVPCLNSDGVAGLYDKVSKQFYSNAGTGTFKAGYPLPAGYTALEYIESDGTQYIDTGFGSTHGWQTELEWMFTVAPTAEQDIMGAIHYDGSNYFREYLIARNNQWSLGLYSSYSYSGSIAANTKYNIKASAVSGNGYLYVDGAKIFEYTTAYAVHAPINIYLFRQNFDQAICPAKGRLYGCKLYDEAGALIRNFVPCINPDGAYGLYDKANATFYGNAGSGAFTGA